MENGPHIQTVRFLHVSFYIVAHADDWQLFMNPNVYYDLVNPEIKVIFIILTSGDAGEIESFWAAREEGSLSSIRFCLAPRGVLSESRGSRKFDQHEISYSSINNITSYFLRLPDGNLDGSGFSRYAFQSLSKLRAGQIRSIKAVDNSATYNSWSELYKTLEMIIKSESQDISEILINYLNPDMEINPNDHTDHILTGQAIQSMSIINNLRQTLFVGYSVNNVQKEMKLNEFFWKVGMFSAYEKALYDGTGYSTLHESIDTYLKWCLSTAKFQTVISSTF